MIIAGAGGHGLEVYGVLISQGIPASEICFYDEDSSKKIIHSSGSKILNTENELKKALETNPNYCLGVGSPAFREYFFKKFESFGGEHYALKGTNSVLMGSDQDFDLMPFGFVGPETVIGKGVLINSRANVHHQCIVGEFSELGPGAILLGGAKVGKHCRIGAGAILLPGVEVGDNVIVGAGAVVTKNFRNNSILKGVPASNQ
ncbi:DapH/DapD/GlmU-related protein [Algoriphagus formosus]|uniref:Hexapeptide transferase n=1 Tax=Algoriphagus formosus TaxID=2007308 RepID=A0A4R5V6S9_9BACT|nr:DapH/DapD/GlmU-related protein [Algoriphagus aquimaris]TDK47305.1 hexapeptide transferase [Algoriphagus aquimaris]